MGFLANCILWMQPHYFFQCFHFLFFISFHCFFSVFHYFSLVFQCCSWFSLFFFNIAHYVFQCLSLFSLFVSVCVMIVPCFFNVFHFFHFSDVFSFFSLLMFFIILHEHVGPTWSNLNWALVSFSSDSAVLDGTWKPSSESFRPRFGTQ